MARELGSSSRASVLRRHPVAIHQYAMEPAQALLRSNHHKAPSNVLETVLPSRVWIFSRASARRGLWECHIAVTVNMRPCLVCGRPSPGPRCREHEIPRRGWQHQQARAAEEWVCWRCGKPGTLADPLTADHVIPRAHGGADARHNMRAAHSSCNKRAGATAPRSNPDRRIRVPESGTSESESLAS
jgi:5-methylcytosine-specific restriction endonuclease McrA